MNITRRTSTVLVGAIIATYLTVTPTSAYAVEGTDPTLTAAGSQAVTESGRVVDFYTTLGFTASDIPAASASQTAKLSSVLDLVTTSTPAPPSLPTRTAPPTDCADTGSLVSYAQQIAEANNAIDANSGSLGQETVYMYMSHFFDLPSICGNNTAYYPEWITNSDRQVYNSYLAASNSSQLATTIPQMILNANSLVSQPAAPLAKLFSARPGAYLAVSLDGVNRANAADSLTDQFRTVSTLLDADSTPEEIVSQMRSNLSSTWSDENTKSAIIGSVAALMMPTVGGALFSLGSIVIGFELTGVNSFMQTAAFNSMRASTSGRAGERVLRSYGL